MNPSCGANGASSPSDWAEIVRRTGPAMLDFQNDKSSVASRQFMEMLEFRSMIFLEATKKGVWQVVFPAAARLDAVCLLVDNGTICQVAGVRVGVIRQSRNQACAEEERSTSADGWALNRR